MFELTFGNRALKVWAAIARLGRERHRRARDALQSAGEAAGIARACGRRFRAARARVAVGREFPIPAGGSAASTMRRSMRSTSGSRRRSARAAKRTCRRRACRAGRRCESASCTTRMTRATSSISCSWSAAWGLRSRDSMEAVYDPIVVRAFRILDVRSGLPACRLVSARPRRRRRRPITCWWRVRCPRTCRSSTPTARKIVRNLAIGEHTDDVMGSPDGRVFLRRRPGRHAKPIRLPEQRERQGHGLRRPLHSSGSGRLLSPARPTTCRARRMASASTCRYTRRHWMVVLNAEDGSIEQWWPATIGNHVTEISADGKRLYVGNMVTDAIYVYDTATGKVVMALDVGESVRPIVLDEPRGLIYYQLSRAARFRGASARATARSCGASSCRRSTRRARGGRKPHGAACESRRCERVALHLQPRARHDPRRPPPGRGGDGGELRGDLLVAGFHLEGYGAGGWQPELGRLRSRGQVRLRNATRRTTPYR